MKTFVTAFVNQKGGVAKTTSVANVGACLAMQGRKVLVVDLDPQGNLSEGLGVNPDLLEKSIYDSLITGVPLKSVLVGVGERLDLVPANAHLAGAESELLSLPDKNSQLKKLLSRTTGYDYILIDCPPSLGQLTVNALMAAHRIYIPVQSEFFALKGLQKLLQTIEVAREHGNKGVTKKIFATMHDGRISISRDVLRQLQTHFGAREMFETVIRKNISLVEATACGKPIIDYRPASYGAVDYRRLTEEILKEEIK